MPSDQVAVEARKSGISFQVTTAVAKEIHDAGGTDALLSVLRSLAPRTATAPANTPRTAPSGSPPVLVIESSPGQSQVYIDDEPVGSTSQQGRLRLTRLTAGDHRVRLSLSGYEDHEESVTLTGGSVTTLAATLVHPSAPLAPPPQPERPQPEQTPTGGNGQPGYLGVLPMMQQPAGARGVVLASVASGSPAERAGLKAYDTILSINGQQVTALEQLRDALSNHQAGEAVQITWYNGSSNVTRQIQLASAPPPGQATAQPAPPPTLSNMPHNGFVTFTVAHDHGPNGQGGNNYCVGTMSIGNGMIVFNGTKGTNGTHHYDIPLNIVKEAGRNKIYLIKLWGVPYPPQQENELQLRGRQPAKSTPAPGRNSDRD